MKRLIGVLIVVVLLLLLSFALQNNGNEKSETEQPKEPKIEVNNLEIKKDTEINMKKATFKTNKGDFVLELFEEKAPKTVENFTKLASEGFYNETKFHRVIAGFMIQGGDPLSKDDSAQAMWGTGDPGYKFEDEFGEGLSNVVGTISMANSGPNTNGSQFFINVADNTYLDGKHAVFGKVIEGMDIVEQISNAETGPRDIPVDSIIIESIEISE